MAKPTLSMYQAKIISVQQLRPTPQILRMKQKQMRCFEHCVRCIQDGTWKSGTCMLGRHVLKSGIILQNHWKLTNWGLTALLGYTVP